FVRDMRQKAPEVFKLVERRRAALIQRYFGKFFVEGQRVGMVRKDVPANLIIEVLLAMVQSIMNPPKMEELGMMPKEGFTGILRLFSKARSQQRGEKRESVIRSERSAIGARSGSFDVISLAGRLRRSWKRGFRNHRSRRSTCGPALQRACGESFRAGRRAFARRPGDRP